VGVFLFCFSCRHFLNFISYQCVPSDIVLLQPEVTGLNIPSSFGRCVEVIALEAGLCGAVKFCLWFSASGRAQVLAMDLCPGPS
jgi:hypothetical protein